MTATATKRGNLDIDLAWVACSAREFGEHVGRTRHLIRRLPNDPKGYVLTTACGNSASVHGIWRANTSKPKCRQCVQKVGDA